MIDLRTIVNLHLTDKKFESDLNRAQAKRVRDAGNFLRRTVRKVVSQPAPYEQVETQALDKLGRLRWRPVDGTRKVLESSAPGDPPFRRTGRLYGLVGFDFSAAKGGAEPTAFVVINAYGWETGAAAGKPGVKRPALMPVYQANLKTVAAIIEGRMAAPQLGDVSAAGHRKKRTVREVLGGGRRLSTVTYGRP